MVQVKDVMSTGIDFCTTLDNVYEVAVKMKNDDVGIIPILDEGKLVGVITDRDIVVDGTAEKKAGSTKVTDIMTTKLVTVTPETSIEEAAELMAKHQIRRLPVVEDKRLVGMLSLGDLATENTVDHAAGEALKEISEDK
ncbi:MAG: hypothetical protein K0R71_163 [Bacillales bacterium]|jgi:CBS domain-containing protein|nr:hypothetical protein [Bacillales bacterium]